MTKKKIADYSNTNGNFEQLAYSIIRIVETFIDTYSSKLIRMSTSRDWKETQNTRHRDNFLSTVDLELNLLYRDKLSEILPHFVFASEENEPEVLPRGYKGDLEYVVIVDPLDTSELAVRGLFGYTHILVFCLSFRRPVVAVVGDFFHTLRIYCAYRDEDGNDRAIVKTRSGEISTIRSSKEICLNNALITNYSMRPFDRFKKIAKEKKLLIELAAKNEEGVRRGRIGVDFGSVGLCHVAAGFTDAMIEVARGFKLWDLYPGQYILSSAGGCVTSPRGKDLSLELNMDNIDNIRKAMNTRKKFVAAGNQILCKKVIALLSKS